MRLHWWQVICIIPLGLLFAVQICRADADPQKFLDGIAAYKSGRYQEAISKFEELAASGISNAKLFYNLGNAYLKNKDLGHAILCYERALKLDSDEPDLLFNLSFARSLTKDAEKNAGPSLYRILFFWKYRLSHRTIVLLALIGNGLCWSLLLLRLFFKSKRRSIGITAAAAALPALIFIVTALYNFYEVSHTPKAVILPEKVSVRSGLSDRATELFVLHAGTVVTVQKLQGNFIRIAFSKDKIGWIKRSLAGII